MPHKAGIQTSWRKEGLPGRGKIAQRRMLRLTPIPALIMASLECSLQPDGRNICESQHYYICAKNIVMHSLM